MLKHTLRITTCLRGENGIFDFENPVDDVTFQIGDIPLVHTHETRSTTFQLKCENGVWTAQNGDTVSIEELRLIYDEYTYVRDKIIETMDEPDDWDGDSSEGYIIGAYVKWLADGKPEDRPAL